MEEFPLKSKKLLVVDDEADLREIVASELDFMGAKVFQAPNVSEAKRILEHETIDLVVSDIRMPGGTGIDLLKYLRAKDTSHPPIILITGFADISAEDAFNEGAEALLNKPFKLDELVTTAVRLTKVLEDRYIPIGRPYTKELSFNFNQSLQDKLITHDAQIGRGGMSLVIDTKSFNWEPGDVVKFQLVFPDIQIAGTGVCRWLKPLEKIHKASIGLEFCCLSKESFDFFKNYWSSHRIISFIPSLFP